MLTTTADVKARLRITDATDDAVIDDLIADCSDWIADFTKRQLEPLAAQTYVVDTAYGSSIDMPVGVRVVTSLGIAHVDQPDVGGSYTSVDAADILLRPVSLYRRPGWPATQVVIRGSSPRLRDVLNGARIVADVGFAAVPPRVAAAALDAVVAAYTMRGKPSGQAIGPDENPSGPWAAFFGPDSPHLSTLRRLRVRSGIA